MDRSLQLAEQSSQRMNPIGVVVYPVGAVIALLMGLGFSISNSTHSWGIATPIIFAVLFVVFDQLLPRMGRLARISTERGGAVYGLLLMPWYFVGEMLGATLVEQVSVLDWFSGRWFTGYELFGAGSFAIKSWLWALCYSVRVVIIVYLFVGMFMTEGERTFCQHCKRAAWKIRWESIVGNFDRGRVDGITSMDELMLKPAPYDPDDCRSIQIVVRTCKCCRVADLYTESYNRKSEISGKRLVYGKRVSLDEILDLAEWIQRVDPQAKLPGTKFDAVEDFEEASVEHVAFDQPIAPEGEEWGARYRDYSAMTAMEWRCDTEYTKALRKRIIVGDTLVVPEALGMSTNINDTACIYEASSDWGKPQDWIDQWCTESPESTQAHTVRGINLVKQAWVKRGSGWTPKNYPEFQGLLIDAMDALDFATAIDAQNATAHAWKIYAGKGLQQDREQVRSYFDLAVKEHPDLHAAHWMYYDFVTPKWGGSEEACIAFARERLDASPVGSPSIAVIGHAHFEIAGAWKERDKKNGFKNYLAQPEVRADIFRGNQKAFRDHRMSMVTPRVRAFFAYMLWQTGYINEARAHMEIIGKSTPWDPFMHPMFFFLRDTYPKARKACGL
tara:strand:- start:312915 stop:314759 length:1845 start_codon:yes stop_codon:yes gene_type:complete